MALSEYKPGSTFPSVTVDFSGDLITDSDSEMRLAMSRSLTAG